MNQNELSEELAMRFGGEQLKHLLEHHIRYEQLVRCMYYMRITNLDLVCLKTWMNCNHSVSDALNILSSDYGLVMNIRSYMEFFQRMLHKMRSQIKMEPVLDEAGDVVQPFPFLQYEVYDIEDSHYRIVSTEVDISKFWFESVSPSDEKKFNRLYVFKLRPEGWALSSDKFASRYKASYLKMKDIQRGC